MQLSLKFFGIPLLTLLLSLSVPRSVRGVGIEAGEAQTSRNINTEADRLLELCKEQWQTSQYEAAIESCQQALEMYREIGETPEERLRQRNGEAFSLNNLGIVSNILGEYARAIELYQQSLVIFQEIGNRYGEATSLNNLGVAYLQQGEYVRASEFFARSLPIVREIGNRYGESSILGNLGNIYFSLGEYEKALDFFQQSLPITREIGDSNREADTLNNLGIVYASLGQYEKALDFHQQSLAIEREIEDRRGESNALRNLGIVYEFLGEYERALDFHQQSLVIDREIGNRQGEANSLGNLGVAYHQLRQYQKALDFHQQSLAIDREIGNRQGEANSLMNLGIVYHQLRQYQKALDFFQQSLAICQDIGNRQSEGVALKNIGVLLEEQNQPELAILFYKQSINIAESIRQDIQGLSQELQDSYLGTVSERYRGLADLLLKNDRILEAQRVLDLLKVQELDDYLRNVRGNDNTNQGLPNLPAEREAWNRYQAILDKAVEIGKELSQLEQKDTLTPAEEQRLAELTDAQGQIRQDFNNFTRSEEVLALVTQRSPETLSQDLLLRMGDFNGLQDNLRNLEQNAVLLYPLILDDRLELILTTPDSPPIRRTVNVSKEQLSQTILDFRQAIVRPHRPLSNIQTPAQQLYQWLIEPLENDLEAANAETIIYSPDGQLRYIPLAALHDGENWLVQRYRINHITAYSLTDLDTEPQPQLNVLAGAFTTGFYSFNIGEQAFNFSGLPFAGVEVENLADTVPTTTQLIDTDFTPDAVPQFNRYNTIHLATHGAFVVGTPDESFILFGNGERVTLRDIATWSLTNVDLVVLSACETGLGGNLGNGEEILGLGYQIQSAGARAAIASLWIVDDGGTQVLMNAFYSGLQQNMTKAEALRQAQMALITGDYSAVGDSRGNAIEVVFADLQPQVRRGLSHPYYWAPFILIGNGL